MTTIGWLPAPVEDLFGPEATAEESYEVLTVDVPPTSWLAALEAARDGLGCTYFDWLSAVDEPGTGFRVAAHVAALSPVRRLLVRTTVPHEAPTLPSAVGVYAGAGWHERETHEMFGVDFTDHPALDHLLLPENFEGHPLRKDFVLAARVAKAWPGAKEPGESEHGGPKRRQMLPPGVPDPNEWGPLKGQLPPAPARPARGAGRAAGAAGERPARAAGERPTRAAGERPARAAGERPVRRARTAAEGSASQAVPEAEAGAAEGVAPTESAAPASAPGPARRARTAAEGSASQAAPAAGGPEGTAAPSGPRRSRSASQGSASQRTAPEAAAPETAAPDKSAPEPAESGAPAAADSAPDTAASETAAPKTSRSSDAPWHHARPAFDEPERERPSESEPDSQSESESGSAPEQSDGGEPASAAPETDPAEDNDSAGGPQ
ncbi:NADH-quinone oxidoreductase subunit C [Streptomyces chartreusis]|uniref:NADH-quinone oxidoreductase subunit C n=1 Tax=Streptomyces chartreusis TaxID=1969 RepID=UPI002E197B2D|nr:NADH-quinone oxidoreductase subunit C [Streptomyces chartreusis]